jgi:hypothetical protein
MDYKGYNISDAQSQLLYDILLKQDEILGELKKLNEPKVEIVVDEVERRDRIKELMSAELSNVNTVLEKLDEANVQVVTKPTKEKKPATRAKRKSKAKSKKTTK